MRRPFRPRGPDCGFALIAILTLLIAGALAFLVAIFGPDAMEAYRRHKTEAALAEAREALLGYALRYRDIEMARDPPSYPVYGYLPLPDLGKTRNVNVGCDAEGCDAGNFGGNAENLSVIGRFPWRTVGTEPLRDGHGECIWYAVSGSHKRTQPITPMNWDTLGQLDVVVANGTADLASLAASPHEQPVAIIFSAGPALPNQDRSRSAVDAVDECGGNYDVANYLDPDTAGALGADSNFFGGSPSNATGDTSAAPKRIASQGTILKADDGKLWADACPPGGNCALASNDRGLAITPDVLFGALRKNANFRTDINSLLDRIVSCLRDDIAAGAVITGLNKIQGADDNACYGNDIVPRGYYPNYREMLFVAGGISQVNGEPCAGALLFANQRGQGQLRTPALKGDFSNYLEGINWPASGTFSGQEQLDRVSVLQNVSQDIARCLPSTPSFVTAQSSHLPQAETYSPSSRTLTLGGTVPVALDPGIANYLFQCAWTPEAHAMGGGVRSYFRFRINDAGFSTRPHEGFTFTIVDGDNNKTNSCGAAAQHLGYSGNNTESPFIAPPKLALEIDLRREFVPFPPRPSFGFYPSRRSSSSPFLQDHLANGRNDPDLPGGLATLVYWGGELPIDTSIPSGACTEPLTFSDGICRLPQEEDDNVHACAFPDTPSPCPAVGRAGFAPPPTNPTDPHQLDSDSIPVNQDFHVRVELTRAPAMDFTLPQVRVATTASLDLANPFTLVGGIYRFAIDGVYLFDGDRILVKDQFDARQNGVYVWHADSPPNMTRATDADEAVELSGLMVDVAQGHRNAHSIWRQGETNPDVDPETHVVQSNLIWNDIRVKVAAPASTSVFSPGTTLDGIQMSAGDRVFVKSHGIYIWNGATTSMTFVSPTAGWAIQIQQGSEAPGWWLYNGTWSSLFVRTSTDTTLNLGSPGSVIGGVALANGDRVLVRHQATSAENGIYTWTGASSALTRAADMDSAAELSGALTQVREGTDAGRTFRQTALSATGTLGTNAVQWQAIDGSPTYLLEAWILPESGVYANMIAAMQDTTRPIGTLYPTFTPHLRDRPVIPYPFRNVRLGFTMGQRTTVTDQTITIRNIFSSWLP
jgi:hypothetical protein